MNNRKPRMKQFRNFIAEMPRIR
uniref:Uncharacterized protein n=1 Tax=Anguilla anguilla TaxID=7936 RepID=A0A0E9Q1Y5_ANGAN